MAIRLPPQWPKHIKSGILHAISLVSVALAFARGHAADRRLTADGNTLLLPVSYVEGGGTCWIN